MDSADITIDGAALWADLMGLAGITDKAAPYTRRSFSPLFMEGRRWLTEQFDAAGLATHIDAGGNLIGRLDGLAPDSGTLMIGSHSDTVPSGGRFDGIAGVLTGLEIIRSLRRAGIALQHPIEIVDFLAEEPSEFGLSCIGSRAMAGKLTAPMLDLEDGRGRRLTDAIDAVGGNVAHLARAVRDDVVAFLELHIEQGLVLERGGLDVGIVSGIAGISRFEINLTGSSDHAGATPMNLRKDAGLAAAHVVVAVAAHAARLTTRNTGYFVATCGVVEQAPNAANVVPGRARIVVDSRAEDHATMDEFRSRLESDVAAIAARTGCTSTFTILSDTMPAACDARLRAILTESAAAHGYSTARMGSGAGHDAAFLSHIAPMAMLFVPSKDGKSHAPEEWTDESQLTAGANAMLGALLRLDATSMPGR